jgi:hypothetical protein
MKVVITIDCDNDAFNGADCGSELARILRPLPDMLEFEPKNKIARRYGTKPKLLRATNGDTVGSLGVVREEGGPV